MKKSFCLILLFSLLFNALLPTFSYAKEKSTIDITLVDSDTVEVVENGLTKYVRKTESDEYIKTEVINSQGHVENTFTYNKINNTINSTMTGKTFIIENETSEFNHSLPTYDNEGYSLFGYDGGSCPIGSTKNMEPFSVSYATLAKGITYGAEAASIVAYLSSFRTGLIDIDAQAVYDIHDFWSNARTLSDLYLSDHGLTFHGIGKCQRRCRGSDCYTSYYFNITYVRQY